MPSNDESGSWSHYESVTLMLEVCNNLARLSYEATERGEDLDLTKALDEAVARTNATDYELISLWSLFLLASQAAKRQHTERSAPKGPPSPPGGESYPGLYDFTDRSL